MMRRIDTSRSRPLQGCGATRALEAALASQLPPFELMSRAGTAVARLTLALAPHARRIWVACGPGNNGGDGMVAATHLLQCPSARGLEVAVTLCAGPQTLPADASQAHAMAVQAGVQFVQDPPDEFDIGIDALLGIGAHRAPEGRLAEQLLRLHAHPCPVLAVDVPSGLMAETGRYTGPAPHLSKGPRHTLSLLTLKPGLFTADGRDLAGTVWFDPLEDSNRSAVLPDAVLVGEDLFPSAARTHSSHKGSQGDVVVVGGQGMDAGGAGMTGAALLAGRAALHAGAGRVYVALLSGKDNDTATWDPQCPELMFRRLRTVVADRVLLQQASVVCGCGGGDAVADALPILLSVCHSLVLDADGLNRTAEDPLLQSLLRARRKRGQVTVITPHPLEAARLLSCTTAEVMNDRIAAAQNLSRHFDAICVLKGSGTVVAAPGELPHINGSGNAALATAGTGDVLAGWIGAALAALKATPSTPHQAVLRTVFAHGHQADRWAKRHHDTLTANRLAMAIGE